MSIEENKAVVRNWVAARNKNDLEAALACWTEDTHEFVARAFQQFTVAFPDIHIEINTMVAEGDQVVARCTLTGTQRGVWRGIPATGNTVEWHGIDLYTISNGRIAALDRAADNLAWLQQLGARMLWQDQVIE
jgi:steroid delta-isomerase-like uncharacterized protein